MGRAEDIIAVREKLGIRRKEFSDALCFKKKKKKMLKEWEIGKLEVPDDIYDRIMSFPTEPLFKNRPIEECDTYTGTYKAG